MATPARLIELECPRCAASTWLWDHDFRGMGGIWVPYPERPYHCSACGHSGPGYSVKQASPPEFLSAEDMTPREFSYWLGFLRTHLPDDPRLADAGVSWYPGKRKPAQDERINQVVVKGLHYRVRFNPRRQGWEDPRICVFIQGIGDPHGEAFFSLDPTIELEQLVYGFNDTDIQSIKAFLAEHEAQIRQAWLPYLAFVEKQRAHWLALLDRASRTPQRSGWSWPRVKNVLGDLQWRLQQRWSGWRLPQLWRLWDRIPDRLGLVIGWAAATVGAVGLPALLFKNTVAGADPVRGAIVDEVAGFCCGVFLLVALGPKVLKRSLLSDQRDRLVGLIVSLVTIVAVVSLALTIMTAVRDDPIRRAIVYETATICSALLVLLVLGVKLMLNKFALLRIKAQPPSKDAQWLAQMHGSLSPPADVRDRHAWDAYWNTLRESDIGRNAMGMNDLMASDPALPALLSQRRATTVLCVGNGLSTEALSLAVLGFSVTALDISAVPAQIFESQKLDPEARMCRIPGFSVSDDGSVTFGGPDRNDTTRFAQMHAGGHFRGKSGGSLSFATGDLMKPDVCPGPFDVVIERRTLQFLRGVEQATALERLTARLKTPGLFVSHQDDSDRPARNHFAEKWLASRGFSVSLRGKPGESDSASRAARLSKYHW